MVILNMTVRWDILAVISIARMGVDKGIELDNYCRTNLTTHVHDVNSTCFIILSNLGKHQRTWRSGWECTGCRSLRSSSGERSPARCLSTPTSTRPRWWTISRWFVSRTLCLFGDSADTWTPSAYRRRDSKLGVPPSSPAGDIYRRVCAFLKP